MIAVSLSFIFTHVMQPDAVEDTQHINKNPSYIQYTELNMTGYYLMEVESTKEKNKPCDSNSPESSRLGLPVMKL